MNKKELLVGLVLLSEMVLYLVSLVWLSPLKLGSLKLETTTARHLLGLAGSVQLVLLQLNSLKLVPTVLEVLKTL